MRPSWYVNSHKLKKSDEERGKYWPELGFWDGLTRRKGKHVFKNVEKIININLFSSEFFKSIHWNYI